MSVLHNQQIASQPQHLQDLIRITQHAHSGAEDRSLAIVHVSYLERYLADLLTLHLSGMNADMRKKFFHPDGLLGTIGRKNDMMKALALIDGHEHNAITVLASIRNKFAHNLEMDSFDHPEIAQRVDKLVPQEKWFYGGKSSMESYFEEIRKTRRSLFFGIAQHYCMQINNFLALLNARRQTPSEPPFPQTQNDGDAIRP